MNNDDQRLTAYALGELQGKDKEEFEKELEKNPKLQEEVDAIREFTGDLETEFKLEEELALDGTQRDKILSESRKKNFKLLPVLITAAAACLVVGYMALPQTKKPEMVTVHNDKDVKYEEAERKQSKRPLRVPAEGEESNGPVEVKGELISNSSVDAKELPDAAKSIRVDAEPDIEGLSLNEDLRNVEAQKFAEVRAKKVAEKRKDD